MPGDTPEGPSSQQVHEKRQSGRILDWIDIIAKLATPVAVIAAAWVGARIANSFQERITSTTLSSQRQISGTTLLSEREKAESQLRATMFSSLIGPIVGSQKGGNISADRERLLVELVALNFHEHFEVKPLLERVDQRLQGMKTERESLRSVARRIVDRQIAMLQKESGRDGSDEKGAKVYSLTITEQPKNAAQQKYLEMLKKGGGMVYQLDEVIPDLTSPDKHYKFAMLVTDPQWARHEFTVEIYDNSSLLVSRITSTWADLPLTDNTLFPDGNRFAVVIYRVQDDAVLKNAILKFIWFPKEYFTPRERPLDYGEFLKLVGKKAE